MIRVGEFEKVSIEQFTKAIYEELPVATSELDVELMYQNIIIPRRATLGSAGYDFKMPFSLILEPGQTAKIPTGIRVKIDEGWWLGALPRSGLGFKYKLQLDNTMGVIDSDYYYADNEGHIFAKITNDTRDDKTLVLAEGDGFMQGIFIPYGITYSDTADGIRTGGFGSTGF